MSLERLKVLEDYLPPGYLTRVEAVLTGLFGQLTEAAASGQEINEAVITAASEQAEQQGINCVLVRDDNGQIECWLSVAVYRIGEKRLPLPQRSRAFAQVWVVPPGGADSATVRAVQFHGQFDLLRYLNPLLDMSEINGLRGKYEGTEELVTVPLKQLGPDARALVQFQSHPQSLSDARPRVPGQRQEEVPGQPGATGSRNPGAFWSQPGLTGSGDQPERSLQRGPVASLIIRW